MKVVTRVITTVQLAGLLIARTNASRLTNSFTEEVNEFEGALLCDCKFNLVGKLAD
jgi:hypothetical protein